MMVDLGKYAAAVLSAYGATGVLLAALVGQSLFHGARARRRLAEAEQAHKGDAADG